MCKKSEETNKRRQNMGEVQQDEEESRKHIIWIVEHFSSKTFANIAKTAHLQSHSKPCYLSRGDKAQTHKAFAC